MSYGEFWLHNKMELKHFVALHIHENKIAKRRDAANPPVQKNVYVMAGKGSGRGSVRAK